MADRDRRRGVWVVVVAAGRGERFGAAKQFLDLRGRSVLARSLEAAAGHAEGVVVVLPPGVGLDDGGAGTARRVTGGATRAESVRRGLDAVPADAEVVLVHDAARPLAPAALWRAVVDAVRAGADAAVPVVALTDTIRRRGGGTVERDELVAVQTPQGFPAGVLRRAHGSGAEATDDATLVEADGGTVVLVDGDRRNVKITTPVDLAVAEALLALEDRAVGVDDR